jgi:hypothetical protein
MCAEYHLVIVLRDDDAEAETAPAMVNAWRRMKKKPQIEGKRLRERVRKMQLEDADKSM